MKMTRTKAMEEARAEIGMYRQGDQWVVFSYDDHAGCNRHYPPEGFFSARETVTRFRAETALLKMGYEDEEFPGLLSVLVPERGTLDERISGAIEGPRRRRPLRYSSYDKNGVRR